MKYKVLITRKKSAFVNDLFTHEEINLQCVSTSDLHEDIMNHLALVKPHVFLCVFDKEDTRLIDELRSVRADKRYHGVLFIIAGESESVEYFKKAAPKFRAEFIRFPVSIRSLEEQVETFCELYYPNGAVSSAEKVEEESEKVVEPVFTSSAPAVSSHAQSGKKQILVVDDDKNVLKMMKSALSEDYDVTTIVNGTMALKFLESRRPDLIFLDYEMPMMTGAEVFKKIKEHPGCASIPVVFMTGLSEPEKIKEVLSLRPSGYIVKPVDMDRLEEAVNKNIGNK